MTINITDYIDVRERLEGLGCDLGSGIVLLPINFENAESADEFQQRTETATIKTLLKSADLPCSVISPTTERPVYVMNNSTEWVSPTLFLTAVFLSEHAEALRIALKLITDYLTSAVPQIGREKEIELEIVVEKDDKKSCSKISYQGSLEGLRDVPEVVRAAKDE